MKSNVIYFEDERLLRSYDRIGDSIIKYIGDLDLTWEIEIAKKIYFVGLDSTNKFKDNYKSFIHWLIFSYKFSTGLPLIDSIYKFGAPNSSEKIALENLTNTYESLYKVYSIENDMLLIKDVFTDKKIYIWNSPLAKSVKKYNGIFGRILFVDSKNLLIPGYLVMSNSLLKDMERFINAEFETYSKFHDDFSVHNFIKKNSLLIHRYFLRNEI